MSVPPPFDLPRSGTAPSATAQAPVIASLALLIRSDGSYTLDFRGVDSPTTTPVRDDAQPHQPTPDDGVPSNGDVTPYNAPVGQHAHLTRELVGPSMTAVEFTAGDDDGHRGTVGARIRERELLGCKLRETRHAWNVPLWQFANGRRGALVPGLAETLLVLGKVQPTRIVIWFVSHRIDDGRTPRDLLLSRSKAARKLLIDEARQFGSSATSDPGEDQA